MALPTTLTELDLAHYLASPTVLGPVADALSWAVGDSAPGDFAETVNDALTADLK